MSVCPLIVKFYAKPFDVYRHFPLIYKYTNKEKKKRKRLHSDENITCKKLHVCVGIAIALTTVASTTTIAYLLIKLVTLCYINFSS
jgi:hypothetical protein